MPQSTKNKRELPIWDDVTEDEEWPTTGSDDNADLFEVAIKHFCDVMYEHGLAVVDLTVLKRLLISLSSVSKWGTPLSRFTRGQPVPLNKRWQRYTRSASAWERRWT